MNLGGKEGSRGYLYQTFASIFEALCQKDWDKIYIEYNSENDKVDIALEIDGKIFKSIQVKSSINLFTKSSVTKWLNDLISDDIGANEYSIHLIGNLEEKANVFINALRKYQDNEKDIDKLDNKAKTAVDDFDLSVLNSRSASFVVLPYDIDSLTRIMRDSLNQYLFYKNISLSFDQISLILDTLIAENFISSLGNEGIDRSTFDSKLEEHIKMLSKKERICKAIGIVSFERYADYITGLTDTILSFKDKFDGRKLKPEYDWDKNIYQELEMFLTTNTDPNNSYQLMIEAPLSIAFVAGRILDPKSRISAFPSNPDPLHKSELWNIEDSCDDSFTGFNVRDERIDINEFDTCLIISITHDIKDNVSEYILDNGLKIGRMITLTIGGQGPCNNAIINGKHAHYLANKVCDALVKRTTPEKRAKLHIFAAAPNGFMFFLGQLSRGFGKCIPYEYDFEGRDTASYSPSFQNLM